MSAKRIVIFSFISILLVLLAIGGINMYKKLNYNKLAQETDIYTFIPSCARSVTRINNTQGLQNYNYVDSGFVFLSEPLKKYFLYPLFILRQDSTDLFMTKVNPENEDKIKEIINFSLTGSPYPKQRQFRDATILFYGMPDEEFLACTFHKGIFASSRDYRLVEKIIETGGNLFFTDINIKELQAEIKRNYPADIFHKSDSFTYIMGFNRHSDTLIYEGCIKASDSIQTDIMRLIKPDTVHYNINEIDTTYINNIIFLKFSLNKKPGIMFNN